MLTTLDDLKRSLEITGTTYDAALVTALEEASRLIEDASGLSFLPEIATRYEDGNGKATLWLSQPWLALTTVSLSSDGGSTYTALAATDWWGSDGIVWDRTPYQLLALNPNGNYDEFYADRRAIKLVGVLGWHRDYANAWELSGDAIADTGGINASVTTITVADADGYDVRQLTPRFAIGDLLKIESEYLIITWTNTTTNVLTVRRGMRGSTAATHAKSTVIYKWRADELARQCARVQAGRIFKRGQMAYADTGASIELGQLRYTQRLDPDVEAALMAAGLRRLAVG